MNRQSEYLIHSVIKDSFQEYEDEISLVLFSPHCNLKCPTCHNKSLRNPPLAFCRTVKDVIEKDITPMTGAVVFLGGEPTVWGSSLVRAVEYVKKYNLKTKLFTNGMKPEVVKELLNRNLLNSISVDFKATTNISDVLGVDELSDDDYMDTVGKTLDLVSEYLKTHKDFKAEIRTTAFDTIDLDDVKDIVSNLWGQIPHIIQKPNKI